MEIILNTIIANIEQRFSKSFALKSEIHLYICKIETSQTAIINR